MDPDRGRHHWSKQSGNAVSEDLEMWLLGEQTEEDSTDRSHTEQE